MSILYLLILYLRVSVAAVFIAYAASKLQNPSSFAAVIRTHHLIPASLSSFVAWTLIAVEMTAGVFFLFNVFPLLTGIAIGTLLILFSGVLLRARFTAQLDVRSCGCSGHNKQHMPIRAALLRNLLLLFSVSMVLTVTDKINMSPPSSFLFIETVIFICIIVCMMFIQTKIPGFASSILLRLSRTRATQEVVSHSQTSSRAMGRRSLLTRLG